MEPFAYDATKLRLAEFSSWFETTIEGEPAWVLDFPYATNPVPMNGPRGNPRAHARKIKDVRKRTGNRVFLADIPRLDFCQVQLVWYVTTWGRRDAENLGYLLKAMCDGVVDAGVVVDDVPALMKKHQSDIVRVDHTRNASAWMEFTIRPWQGLASEVLPNHLTGRKPR